MSLTLKTCGDNYLRGWNSVGKRPLAAYAAGALVGDLVTIDTTLGNGIDIIAGTEAIYGIIESLNNSATAPFPFFTVAEFVPGCTIELPYTGVVAVGDKLVLSSPTQGTSVLRTQVKTDNTNGVGTVIAIDADAPHGTGHCVVRF